MIRDALAHELADEPDAVLQEIVAGRLGATPATRLLALDELNYRWFYGRRIGSAS
jgi:hypothetical protein